MIQIGEKYGKLTVLELEEERNSYGQRMYKCKCDCGKISVKLGNSISRGLTKSCGRCKAIEIGDKFGKLTVLEDTKTYKNKNKVYLCECDCGSNKEVLSRADHLRRGTARSCGCLPRPNTATPLKVGDRYGILQIKSEIAKGNVWEYKYLCTCDCGNTKIVTRTNLLQGNTKSCGCLLKYRKNKTSTNFKRKESKVDKYDAAYEDLYCDSILDIVYKYEECNKNYY